MGQCTSSPACSPVQPAAQHGSLLMVIWEEPAGPARDFYHVRARSTSRESLEGCRWWAFNSMGLLVETSGGHLDAVLVKPAAEGRDVLMRMDFDALLRRPDIKLLAVAPPAPALSQLESRCVTQFANQAASLAEPSKRVRILSSRGRKLFVAQLVAELLVAMGRHVQQEDVYRSRQGSWTMPDLTFMTLPNRPSTPPQRKGTPSDKESGVSRPAQRTAQQPSTQVNSRSGSSSGSSSGGRYSASGAGGLVPLDYTQTEPLPVQHPMMHAGSVQVAHGSAFADVLMTSTLSHDQLIAHRISLGSMCSGRLSEGGPFAAACGQGASSRRSSHSPATLVPCHSSGPAHGHVGGLSSSQWCVGSVGSDGGSALMVAISSSTPTNMLQARAVLV